MTSEQFCSILVKFKIPQIHGEDLHLYASSHPPKMVKSRLLNADEELIEALLNSKSDTRAIVVILQNISLPCFDEVSIDGVLAASGLLNTIDKIRSFERLPAGQQSIFIHEAAVLRQQIQQYLEPISQNIEVPVSNLHTDDSITWEHSSVATESRPDKYVFSLDVQQLKPPKRVLR